MRRYGQFSGWIYYRKWLALQYLMSFEILPTLGENYVSKSVDITLIYSGVIRIQRIESRFLLYRKGNTLRHFETKSSIRKKNNCKNHLEFCKFLILYDFLTMNEQISFLNEKCNASLYWLSSHGAFNIFSLQLPYKVPRACRISRGYAHTPLQGIRWMAFPVGSGHITCWLWSLHVLNWWVPERYLVFYL